ncbi:GTP-binding protein EngB [Oenococcus oeni S25]|uniref:ribosome biogenesis GTP-binding protein YihA/YsxC n=1 Tax=Oenococcus oeni TaxID=1247 RepID=UPI00050E22E7|nr:ribosome biogenesis GTP-binding protein YihA/YsxC [Oenococcus oeni]KGO15839.1 GTP-binding protein EngB [Oenococcus oeni X2L]KGH55723.1 GTP-binding protein EngB [Oenococcus oeni S22]KGH69381.1 GTP-binding protein EngB [Oenococcus oeni S25]KGH79538.1 GTP-binding protein EngB [Oenococcus oeni IOEB_0607]KGH90585.1 GTP-binding protein EngB [Oenococcus oeni IOEB_L26_1]
MKITNPKLIISAVSKKQYPAGNLSEIAFVGRSNVGKSSLINTLIERNGLAHTSGQPGKTQTLNFYNLDEKLFFVDVPGYGYAKVSKAQREQFGSMVEEYLSSRDQLKGVISLIDARHEPTEDDKLMYNWLEYYQVPILIVATKADKVASGKFNAVESQIKKTLKFNSTTSSLILFSAIKKFGAKEIWNWIEGQAELQE